MKNKKIFYIIFLLVIGFIFSYKYFYNDESTIIRNSIELTDKNKHRNENSTKFIAQKKSSVEVKELLANPRELRFGESDDLFAFALELLDYSRNNDYEAQYFLAKILLTCKGSIDLFSRDKNTVESGPMLELTDWYAMRCSNFTNDNIKDFGSSDEWLITSSKGNYAPAIVAELMMLDEVPMNQDTLSKLRLGIESRQHDVMSMIADLSKTKLTSESWRLLACDFGYDCSKDSREAWRTSLLAHCSLENYHGSQCDTDVDYTTYIKSKYSLADFEEIMQKKENLKNTLYANRVNELTLKQILGN